MWFRRENFPVANNKYFITEKKAKYKTLTV